MFYFSWAESSRETSPKPSRAVSEEDVKRLPIITESSEPEKISTVLDESEMAQFPGGQGNGTATFLFPKRQTNGTTKPNGYLMAETTLNNAKVSCSCFQLLIIQQFLLLKLM